MPEEPELKKLMMKKKSSKPIVSGITKEEVKEPRLKGNLPAKPHWTAKKTDKCNTCRHAPGRSTSFDVCKECVEESNYKEYVPCKKCNLCVHNPLSSEICKECIEDSKYEEEFILCENCGKHRGTVNWVGDGGVLAYTHGWYKKWCKCCCLKAQLEFCKEAAEKIPALEEELTKSDTNGECENMNAFPAEKKKEAGG